MAWQMVLRLEPGDPARGPAVVVRTHGLGIIQARERHVQKIGLGERAEHYLCAAGGQNRRLGFGRGAVVD